MSDQERTGERPAPGRARTLAGRCFSGMAARVRSLPLHPFLFAAASVFTLYASNLREVNLSDMAAALAGALGAALVLFLVFGALFRPLGIRAAMLASIVIVASLFYVEFVSLANRVTGVEASYATAWPAVLVVAGALLAVAARVRADLTLANAVLNGVAFVLFITPAWQVASHEWRTGNTSSFLAEALEANGIGPAEAASAGDATVAGETPDIYYIIFDRYGSEPMLARYYGFDNSALTGFLEKQGFYVASRSHSNYLKTAHSLASVFHMDYLDSLAEALGKEETDWRPIHAMLKEHRVGRFLKSANYRFVQIGSWWGPTQHNPFADENYSFGYSEFTYRYLRNTILPPLLEAIAPSSVTARRMRWDNGQCHRVPRQIEKIKEMGARDEATFVFAHLLIPHGPNTFDAQGRCLSAEERGALDAKQGYLDQLRYTNTLIRDLVSTLLAGEGPKPVIILQADEGPFPERSRSAGFSWREATAEELRVKTGILNAYYFPDGDYTGVYEHITSVNTFPLVLNKHFGTNLERHPDRIYAFPDGLKIYDFFDVTDSVRGDG